MGIFDILLNNDNNKSKEDYNELDDYQKELIKKGEYDSSSFEEEDLEDDDNYYEDDN